MKDSGYLKNSQKAGTLKNYICVIKKLVRKILKTHLQVLVRNSYFINGYFEFTHFLS
jgi:hypothetical protein